MQIQEAIDCLKQYTSQASQGLPQELFLFISGLTPMVNVDLLIKDEDGRVLLAWRDDPYAGVGWHVPGGIIRYQEQISERLQKVAELEIGTEVRIDPDPIAVHEIIDGKLEARGHFISLLYPCFVSSKFNPPNKGLSTGDTGYLQWHTGCPDDLIQYHSIYRQYM